MTSSSDTSLELDRSKASPTPVSTVLQGLIDAIPGDHFTLEWLLGRLDNHSFGVIIFVLALAATVPGLSMLAGPLLAVPALEMILGRNRPTFPRRIATHPLPARYLLSIMRRGAPVLIVLEKLVHPRGHIPPDIAKRAVGVAVLLLSVLFLLPLPLIQIVPALLVALISLAYLEQDGPLLAICLLGALVLLAIAALAAREAILGAAWIGRIASPS